MSITDSITQGYKSSSGSTTTVAKSYVGDGVAEYDGSVVAGQVNLQITIAVPVARVKSLLLYATKAVTIKTNSTSSPAATITLTDGQSIVWGNDYAATNPLGSTDVTSIYVSNAGAAASAFKFRALLDVTPAV